VKSLKIEYITKPNKQNKQTKEKNKMPFMTKISIFFQYLDLSSSKIIGKAGGKMAQLL
jgi:hypothetical protein